MVVAAELGPVEVVRLSTVVCLKLVDGPAVLVAMVLFGEIREFFSL